MQQQIDNDLNNHEEEKETQKTYYVYSPTTFRFLCVIDKEIALNHKTEVAPPNYDGSYQYIVWNKTKWDVKVFDEDRKLIHEIVSGVYDVKPKKKKEKVEHEESE